MKKLFIVLTVVGALCLTGCGADEKKANGSNEKVMTCKRTANQTGVSMDLSYNVSYKNNVVTKVESIEKITSENDDVLETYKDQIEKTYAPYKNIEYYDYNVTIDGNTLTSKADIDYSKIDTDKMIEIDSANGQIIKNGKINIDTLKSLYESIGATCEK
ncbi:MAG: DUF1307 domain-containing protein [Bacilli bacterium]|nr:DUF1307 domain-containing protein [Bacilli bacterium]